MCPCVTPACDKAWGSLSAAWAATGQHVHVALVREVLLILAGDVVLGLVSLVGEGLLGDPLWPLDLGLVLTAGLREIMGSDAELVLARGVEVVRVRLVLAIGMVLVKAHLGAMGLVGDPVPLVESSDAPPWERALGTTAMGLACSSIAC